MKKFFVFVILCINNFVVDYCFARQLKQASLLSLIAIIVHFVFCIEVSAVPAKPGIITLKHLDGTELKVRLCGDENYHYYETLDGERLQITDYKLQITDDSQRISRKRQHSSQFSTFNFQHSIPQRAPHQAERGLVILVEFSDVRFEKTRQNFDDLLNKEGYNYNGATGSARDYFRDASNGQYVPQFDVYGPYKLDKQMSYYGQNDYQGLDKHPDQMVVDAVAKLNATENIDFTDYDTDNDGYIDNIFVYYAGYGENEGASENTVWPHAWEVYDENVTGQLVYDGKQLRGYACTSELQGTSGSVMCGIGTFCHEFGHVLGLPDFYVTDYSSSHKTLGDWDIMDSGSYLNDGNTPPTYSAHERFYLGWLKPEILNTSGDFLLEDLQKSNKAYIITSSGKSNLDGGNPNPATYYLLENRQKTGWDAYLPGHGMMITKTVYDENKWYNNVPNNIANQQGYDMIEADGKAPNGTYGKPGDLFPGPDSVTAYTLYSTYHVNDIVENDSVVSFLFSVDENISDSDGVECFVETFDGLTDENSVDIVENIDEYADNVGWEGYKLFCSNGELIVGSDKYAGYVITPELGVEGDVKVEFMGRASDAEAIINFAIGDIVVESLKVGLASDIYTFELKNLHIFSRIKISSGINRFYVENFKVCEEQGVSTIVIDELEDVILIEGNEICELIGVIEGAIVYCYDTMGRLLWSKEVDDNRFEFVAPQGFYLLQVIDDGKVSIVKGVKN